MTSSAREALPYRERRISAQDGLSLYFRDYGDPLSEAPSLICLPGLARNAKDFHDLARRHAGTRRVICPDYRGRGRSDYDPDWRNYRPETYVRDIINILAATNLHQVVICGTSMGGLLAMGIAVASPTLLAGVVMNDVGPVIEASGVERIRGYIGQSKPLADWEAAIAALKQRHAELGYDNEDKWRRFAEATYRVRDDATLMADWDTNIAKTLGGEIPDLWPLFRALGHIPVLALRGANSSILSESTFARMLAELPELIQVTVPGVGHAPALDEAESEQAIDDFLARIDQRSEH